MKHATKTRAERRAGSTLLPGHVVKYDHLDILISLNVMPLGVVTGLHLGINYNDLTITLVLEEQSLLMIWIDLKVWTLVAGAVLCIPVVEGEICRAWQQFLLPLEVRLEVLDLQPVTIVDVAGNLLPLCISVTDEDDSAELPVPHEFFSGRQMPQE